MLTETDNTFGKREHLCKRTLIERLFRDKAGTVSAWPLKMVYLVVDKEDAQSAPVEVMMSVSKRSFKRAVKRNRVKRQLREAYRKQKLTLVERLSAMPGKQLLLAVVWQDAKLHDSAEVDAKMGKGVQRLAEKI